MASGRASCRIISSIVFGAAPDLARLDLVDPIHTQAIGLVLADRDPPSPMAGALLAALKGIDIDAELNAAMKPIR